MCSQSLNGQVKGSARKLRFSLAEVLLQRRRRPARAPQLHHHLHLLCWPVQRGGGHSAETDAASAAHGPATSLGHESPEMSPFASRQRRRNPAQPISRHRALDATAAVIAAADGSDTEPAEQPAGCSTGEADHTVRVDVAGAAAAVAGAAGIDASPGSQGVAGTGETPSGRRPAGTAAPAAVDAC